MLHLEYLPNQAQVSRWNVMLGKWRHFFLSYIYLGVQLLSHTTNLCFMFWRTVRLFFPQRLYHFSFPTAVYGGSNFYTFSPTLIIICILDYSHPNVAYCGFNLQSPDCWWYWDHFMYLLWPFVYLLWRCVYSDPLLIFNWVVCVFIIEFYLDWYLLCEKLTFQLKCSYPTFSTTPCLTLVVPITTEHQI